ncbi:hypothetical protein ED709_14245 [Escherichia coli]|nr:hypothetical protein [Escherichia coli]
MAQAWAGTGFGHLAIPRVGQEVIVDFLNGDPDQPIIMGRTYHQENRTPGSLPGTKTQMTIRSKTYKGSGFNELKFDDATGKEQVYIHAQKNMNTEVLNNRTTDVINNHAETIGNNQMIAVTNNQIQTVGVNQIETVGSKARLVLTKDGQIFLNGTKIHLQGKEQVNGDSLLINWNCAASKSPPKTPDEKQDTPDMREY